MAKQRIEARVNVSQTAKSKRELKKVDRQLSELEKKAKKVQKEGRKADKSVNEGGTDEGTRLSRFFGRMRVRGPKFSLTSEGLQAGVFKINETGLAVEGVWSKVGGPALFAAGVGRIGSALTGVAVHVLYLKKQAERLGTSVSTFSVLGAGAASTLVRAVRVPLHIGGIETMTTNLLALWTGDSIDKVRELGIEVFFKSINDALTPKTILDLGRQEVRRQVNRHIK